MSSRPKKMSDERERIVLVQNFDNKIEYWHRYSRLARYSTRCWRSGVYVLFDFASALMSRDHLDAVIVRYLNDRSTFCRNLANAILEIATVCVARMLGKAVIWICHNVDRESISSYARISRLRRSVMKRLATQIFVTDPLLLPHALKALGPSVSKKLNWTTFGTPNKEIGTQADFLNSVLAFAQMRRDKAAKSGKHVLIGLVAGMAGRKTLHFDYAHQLLQAAQQTDSHIALVVVGAIYEKATPLQRPIIQHLAKRDDVLFFPQPIELNERDLLNVIDFFWRGYDDLSMSYSLYAAAEIGKPVLALNTGFVAEAVRRYRLGSLVENDFSNLKSALQSLKTWIPEHANVFLESHSWKLGGDRIAAAILDNR